MMELKLSKMNHFFNEKICICEQRKKDLQADDRMDEAVFEKVKLNVYDIFRTILSVSIKSCENNPEKVEHFFMLKTEQIPVNWITAYEKAEQNHDIIKMQIEKIKLDTIGEIKEKFRSIWEGKE